MSDDLLGPYRMHALWRRDEVYPLIASFRTSESRLKAGLALPDTA